MEDNVVQQAVQVFTEVILREIQADPHLWSEKPCSTCRTIFAMIGKPFGCYEFARIRRKQRETEKK